MSTVWPELEPLLPRVAKPARYIGCEDGAVVPQHAPHKVSWLLLYPDTYEIGLPNQGLQILYELLNERDDAVAERSYAPWTDLEAEMRRARVPLFSVDTHRAAGEFDLLAFNLSAELTYTNLLNCVDLAGAPVRAEDRRPEHPLVIAGGHCTYNPEPLADFLDAVVLGDGEEVIAEITEVVGAWKRAGRTEGSRSHVLRELSKVPGVYVPSMYEVTYDGERLVSVTPRYPDVPERVEKRTIASLADWPYPKNQLVPLTEVVHDRLNVEVFRGCTRGCRFCQAGMITRPVRERPAEQVRTMVAEGLRRTGYDEVALTSLSTADFSGIETAVADIVNCGDNVSVSLPSLRVDAFTVGIAAQIQKARRTGLTFAPEAGTWRMRQVINKLIREEDLYSAVDSAYSQGWRRVKLYFLIGLPTETDEDTLGIVELARNCVEIGRRHNRNVSATASVGGFVPKPFTPFQWFGQNTVTELQRKVSLLRGAAHHAKGVQLKWHDPKATLVEGILSRGDRRVGRVIESVWRAGGTFQEWSEHFGVDRWLDAMAEAGLSVDWYTHRHRTEDEVLPWDHLSAGLHKDFLWQDWRDALAEVGLPDCRWTPCYDCGACTGYGIEHVVASATPPAGGSQGTGQDLATAAVGVPVALLPRRAVDRPDASPVTVGGPGAGAGTGDGHRSSVGMRLRVRFAKTGKVRFLSHRDLARIWERTLRKLDLPVAYSSGFAVRQKLHFGLALSTGYESLGEYLDIDLDPARLDGSLPDLDELRGRFSAALPVGLDCLAVAVITPGGASLQEAVTSCTWVIGLDGGTEAEAETAVAAVLAASELPVTRERKGRSVTDDIRADVLALSVCRDESMRSLTSPCPVTLVAELGTQPRTLRPSELVRALGATWEERRVCRLHQWIEHDGTRREPLDAGAELSWVRERVRAS